MSQLNFARWMERLGIKVPRSPILIESVQPVVIAQDLTHLVNMPLLPSGIVGGSNTPGAGLFSTLQCVTPVPLRFGLQVRSTLACRVMLQILPAPLVLAGAVTLTPQAMHVPADPFESFWQTGSVAVAPSANLPQLDLTAGGPMESTGPFASWLYVPAGSTLAFVSDSAANPTMRWWCVFYELPGDLLP